MESRNLVICPEPRLQRCFKIVMGFRSHNWRIILFCVFDARKENFQMVWRLEFGESQSIDSAIFRVSLTSTMNPYGLIYATCSKPHTALLRPAWGLLDIGDIPQMGTMVIHHTWRIIRHQWNDTSSRVRYAMLNVPLFDWWVTIISHRAASGFPYIIREATVEILLLLSSLLPLPVFPTQAPPLYNFHTIAMSLTIFVIYIVLALSHISSASELYYKRAGGAENSLYAFGTNISGEKVFYGDGEPSKSHSLQVSPLIPVRLSIYWK